MRKSHSASALAWALVGLFASGGAAGQGPSPRPSAGGPDQGMAPRLARFAGRIKDAPRYRVAVAESWTTEGALKAEQGSTRYDLAVERPGKFAIRVQPEGEPRPSLEVACPGQTVVSLLAKPEPIYARARPRDPIEGLKHNPVLALSLANSFLDLLMRPDMAEYVSDSLSNAVDLGTEEVGEPKVKGRHFRGVWADGRDLDLWFAEEGEPLLVQLQFTRLIPPVEPQVRPFKLVSVCRYSWTLDREIDAKTFEVALPEGARPVDDLYATVTGAGRTLTPGQKAPEIDLAILGGGRRLRLADHLGRDIVVLNFWATWYPIGVESLPTIAEFARGYTPRGVTFYQVNMAEDPDVVERFVATVKDPLLVALDPDGRVMEAYSVRALPFSVVIGKDGTVQAVNAGDLRGFRERFKEQLDTLLGGKSLVGAAEVPKR